jgi:hypothetical protein
VCDDFSRSPALLALARFPRNIAISIFRFHFINQKLFLRLQLFPLHLVTGKKQLIAASSSQIAIKKENYTSQQVSQWHLCNPPG